MANNYTLFSAAIEKLTQSERDWWTNTMESVEEGQGLLGFGYVDFEWSIDSDDSLWIHAEEYGDVYQVCSIVQTFLKDFRPREIFTLEWANTCSKPRVGEFGGGAAIVSADDIHMMNTSDWIRENTKFVKRKIGMVL